jgi:hypothetical protein
MVQHRDSDQLGRQIHDAQSRLAQQEALVRRSIVQGTPTQAAEDQLRRLAQALVRMKERRAHTRTSEIGRKMRDHRPR